jgi:PucR C-terminal helix-turn-helix domain/GGDEF-like domain
MAARPRNRRPLPPPPTEAPSFERARAALLTRLRARRAEIEEVVLTRTFSISGPSDSVDPEYLEGLRASISVAVEYALDAIERGEEGAPSPPPILLAQARLAARNGIGLDMVLRRYSAGYVLLADFLIEEAEQSELRGEALQRLLRSQGSLDRLLAAVSEEYAREASETPGTDEQRRAERIERLLAGEPLDTSAFAYDFEGVHLGAIGSGPDVWQALRDLAAAIDASLLAVRRDEGTVWAWFSGRRTPDCEELRCRVGAEWPAQATLVLGELGRGLSGWRLTHRQARAALPVALRSSKSFIRYADVALLAGILQDDLLATSLRELYLVPLSSERDGGEVARETLSAYFTAERNISSAAAALGVSRRTVTNRLRAIEARLGRKLGPVAGEVEAALRLDDLGGSPSSPSSPR